MPTYTDLVVLIARGEHAELSAAIAAVGYPQPPADEDEGVALLGAAAMMDDTVALDLLWAASPDASADLAYATYQAIRSASPAATRWCVAAGADVTNEDFFVAVPTAVAAIPSEKATTISGES